MHIILIADCFDNNANARVVIKTIGNQEYANINRTAKWYIISNRLNNCYDKRTCSQFGRMPIKTKCHKLKQNKCKISSKK